MKEQENNTLRQQHSALKSELQREKARERALEQENALLKSWMEEIEIPEVNPELVSGGTQSEAYSVEHSGAPQGLQPPERPARRA